jgi:hypothetical protein
MKTRNRVGSYATSSVASIYILVSATQRSVDSNFRTGLPCPPLRVAPRRLCPDPSLALRG